MMFHVVLFIVGACWGSFLSCAYERRSRGISLWGRSVCPSCGVVLRWYNLVPVVSYLFQGGRCMSCGSRIPLKDFLFELFFGGLFVIIGMVALHVLGYSVT
jgi:leader peptidase (prepilin peptidase)/N-methyltransferase